MTDQASKGVVVNHATYMQALGSASSRCERPTLHQPGRYSTCMGLKILRGLTCLTKNYFSSLRKKCTSTNQT